MPEDRAIWWTTCMPEVLLSVSPRSASNNCCSCLHSHSLSKRATALLFSNLFSNSFSHPPPPPPSNSKFNSTVLYTTNTTPATTAINLGRSGKKRYNE